LKFFSCLILSAAVIAALTSLGVSSGYFERPTFLYKTLLLLLFSTGIIFIYLYKANRSGYFIQLYLLTMVIKVLAYCTYNLIMIMSDKPGAIHNVVFFMIAYFIFTGLEIGFLYRKIAAGKRS
jgi:hypothetical protein